MSCTWARWGEQGRRYDWPGVGSKVGRCLSLLLLPLLSHVGESAGGKGCIKQQEGGCLVVCVVTVYALCRGLW